jgi:hypothetical protein
MELKQDTGKCESPFGQWRRFFVASVQIKNSMEALMVPLSEILCHTAADFDDNRFRFLLLQLSRLDYGHIIFHR